jgi:hypothetical protein
MTYPLRPEYPVFQRLLDDAIQERIPIQPEYLVIHSTANPGVGDESHYKWLNSARQHGWANYYGDWDSISLVVPEGMMAPAQGPSANKKAISYEICEPDTKLAWAEQVRQFTEAWNRAVWTAADICWRMGWPTDKIKSHADISKLYPSETDHQDPIAFFARYGKSFPDFRGAVSAKLVEWSTAYGQADDWQYKAVQDLTQIKVTIDGKEQSFLQTVRHPYQPVQWWEFALMLQRVIKSR